MNEHPARVPASLTYVLGTALLAGTSAALLSYVIAGAVGVSKTIAAVVTAISAAAIVGLLIHKHGRPRGEFKNEGMA